MLPPPPVPASLANSWTSSAPESSASYFCISLIAPAVPTSTPPCLRADTTRRDQASACSGVIVVVVGGGPESARELAHVDVTGPVGVYRLECTLRHELLQKRGAVQSGRVDPRNILLSGAVGSMSSSSIK